MNKLPSNDVTPPVTTITPDRRQEIKVEGNTIRYLVPGLYLTPFSNRCGGCLKARC